MTWQGASLLPDCLDSLRRQTLAHDVLVVDNASTDGTLDLLEREYPEVQVLRNERNLGFAGGVHTALRAVQGDLVALLNNDATAEPEWLAELVAEMEAHPEAAAVTSRMYLAGRSPRVLNNTGVVLLSTGYGADRGLGAPDTRDLESGEVFGFSGGAALLRASAVRAVGGFPDRFFLYYEDTDTSWRLRAAGWSVRYAPGAVVQHRHSATADQRSALFAFYNERNRLLTLARCAPVGRAVALWGRFVLTTASLAAQGALGRRPPGRQFEAGVRLRSLASAARLLPWAWRGRTHRRFWPEAD